MSSIVTSWRAPPHTTAVPSPGGSGLPLLTAVLILLISAWNGANAAQATNGALQLLAPSEQNLTLEWGERYDVQWTSALPRNERIKVALYDSQGSHWDLAIVKGRDHWVWQVGKRDAQGQPNYSKGVGYRIRVSTLNDGAADYSNYDFAIGTPVSIGVTGPSEVAQQAIAQYHCIAQYDAGTTADVTGRAKWKAFSPFARMSKSGLLTTRPVPSDQPCMITAEYGRGDSALATGYEITITKEPPTTTTSTTTTLPPITSTTSTTTTTAPTTTTTSTSTTTTLEPATTSTTASSTTTTSTTTTSTTATLPPTTTTSSTTSTTTTSTTTTTLPPNTLTIESVAISEPESTEVPRYAKVELLVTLSHVAATRFYEPDPAADGLDLSATFTSPSEAVWNVNGFYDGAHWLVRFAPDEVGDWTFGVRAQDTSGVSTWSAGAFTCTASSHVGWPRVSERNLRFASGQSFFAIGHNTGWQADVEQPAFADMAASGENLLSFWLAMPWAQPSWATPEDSSWAERAPIENSEQGIGNYNPAACAYIDGVVARAEAAGVCLLPTIWSHGQLRDAGHPWGQGWWANNAYNSICSATDFFKTSASGGDTPQWRYQKNFYRYLIARWGASRAIAGWVLLCEMDGTTGYVQNRAQTEAWCITAMEYFRQLDPFRRNAGGQYPIAVSKLDQPSWNSSLDMRVTDTYQQKNNNTAIAATVASQTATLRTAGLPGFHTEFGGDVINGATQPAHLHNGLWAGSAAGAAMTPLLWCDGGNYPMLTPEMSNQLKYLAEFVSGLGYLADSTASPASLTLDSPSCRAWGMALSDRACAWVQNTSGTMAGQSLTFSGLDDGSYSITWYDVWSSGATPIATDDVASAGGTLALTIPELARSDIACRVVPAGSESALRTARSTTTTPRAVEPAAGPEPSRRIPSRLVPERSAPTTARSAAAEPTQMKFSRGGINGGIAAAVERVVGPGRVQVATLLRGDARLVCVVVDADRRCQELDRGLKAKSFPALVAGGFSQPSDPLSRTMSIYRSAAMQSIRYQAEHGDRVIVLLCPRDQWSQLQLQWPP